MVCVPSVAVPTQTTDPFGLDAVPALKKDSDRASLLDANDPVPHVITVATGNIKPFDVLLTLLEPKPLTP